MSNGTNDWWLKKLLKMDRALVEQAREIKTLTANLNAVKSELRDSRVSNNQHVQGLLDRIHQMAPEKQFEVVFDGPIFQERLKTKSISSSNGITTIHVERTRS